MKKIILIVMLMVLNSCAFTFDETTKVVSESKSSKIYITEFEVFGLNQPHFCYFFLSSCVSCEAIKRKIEVYASEHDDFYMIEAPQLYQKGILKEESVGAKDINDVKFLGFPTLIFVENNSLTHMYVGINEITNILF